MLNLNNPGSFLKINPASKKNSFGSRVLEKSTPASKLLYLPFSHSSLSFLNNENDDSLDPSKKQLKVLS